MEKKVCSKCKSNKPADQYSKNSSKKDGLNIYCKICARLNHKNFYEKNKDKVLEKHKKWWNDNKKSCLEKEKEYRAKNKDIVDYKNRLRYLKNKTQKLTQQKKHREENKEKYLEYSREYYIKNKVLHIERGRKYKLNKSRTDINFKLMSNLRSRVYSAIKGKSKSKHTIELLGCSVEELKIHLEKKFTKGMGWKNYGLYGWHIDHIKPCSSFDLTDPEQQKLCFHYSNLQPLWAKDNIKKSNKY
jgi:hypothetical protein